MCFLCKLEMVTLQVTRRIFFRILLDNGNRDKIMKITDLYQGVYLIKENLKVFNDNKISGS